MKRYGAILFLALLVVPVLLAGMALYRWLVLEQDRIERSSLAAAEAQARAFADGVRWSVDDVSASFARRLAALDPDSAADVLRQWEIRDPLVRHAFVWSSGSGLSFPDLSRPTDAERQFAARFASLFAPDAAWPDIPPPDADPSSSSLRPTSRRRSSADPAPSSPSGCIPWFDANRLHLLVWSASPDFAVRRGVEIETMALVSRLAPLLPASMPPGMAIALLDANGQPVFQRGESEIDPSLPRLASVQLAPALPHWEVAVYRAGPGLAASGKRFGRALLAILVAAFVLVPLSAGLLLWRQARRDARDALRKTSFVANVSHELKTPLTTIRMYSEMLLEGRVRDESKRNAYLETIVRESRRLARLVNNVLDFGRMEQGRKNYAPAPFDAAEAAAAILRAQIPRLDQSGISLALDFPPSCPVLMDRDAFEQALLNLVDNAAKYAAAGRSLSVSLSGRVLRVRDRGPGVPHALREKIFERFFRADDSLSSGQTGSGLGLTIARRLMRDQGGDLLLESSAPGACFALHLPAHLLTPHPPATPENTP